MECSCSDSNDLHCTTPLKYTHYNFTLYKANTLFKIFANFTVLVFISFHQYLTIFSTLKTYLSREKGSRFEVLKVDGNNEGAKEEDETKQVHIRVVVFTFMAVSHHGAVVHLQLLQHLYRLPTACSDFINICFCCGI